MIGREHVRGAPLSRAGAEVPRSLRNKGIFSRIFLGLAIYKIRVIMTAYELVNFIRHKSSPEHHHHTAWFFVYHGMAVVGKEAVGY
jgi:hypothetical protein